MRWFRVFPVSDKSQNIIAVFEKIIRNNKNIDLQLKESVKKINKLDTWFSIRSNEKDYFVDKVVIATGGNAYAKTGSSGDAYDWARKLWHTITPLWPSLSSFLCKENWIKKLSGLSFANARIFFELDWQKRNVDWALLFTHFGISGPLVFAVSAYLAHEEISDQKNISISISIDKDKNFEEWTSTILNVIKENPNKQMRNIINKFLPNRFVEILESDFGFDLWKQANSFTKTERKNLCHILSWKLKITLIWHKNGDEFVTAGGISTKEINPKTMESLICPGLYFIGEVLDIDWITGGFNLQSAWCTWKLSADAICQS